MSAEVRGWVRVAASVAAYAVIGGTIAAGLYALVWIMWAGARAFYGG